MRGLNQIGESVGTSSFRGNSVFVNALKLRFHPDCIINTQLQTFFHYILIFLHAFNLKKSSKCSRWLSLQVFINSKVNEMTDLRALIVVQPVAGRTN